jgi:hypothetical protein
VTRWLESIFGKSTALALVAGVLLCGGASQMAVARAASREALRDSPSAVSAPFLHATAPHRVDAGTQTERRAARHSDTPLALHSHARPIGSSADGKSPDSRDPRTWTLLVARGYDATAPPRLLS